MLRRQVGIAAVVFTFLVLGGCGGGKDDNSPETPPATQPPPPPAPARGDLLTSPPTKLNSYTSSQLLTSLGGNDIGKALLGLTVNPVCGVDVYQLQYQTVGAKAESV